MKDSFPLVNILTRTSRRPRFFANCQRSVKEQDYPNIRWIVGCDDAESVEYCSRAGADLFVSLDYIPTMQNHFGANLYLNTMMESVTDGWVLYLDDDDVFTSPQSVSKMVAEIDSDGDIIIWRVEIKGGERAIPSEPQDIRCGNVTGQCIMFHNKHRDKFKWTTSWTSDHDTVVSPLRSVLTDRFIPETLIRFQQEHGCGRREDLR